MKSVDQRREVFERIREALRIKAPHRHATGHELASAYSDQPLPITHETLRAWLPKVGDAEEEQWNLFSENAAQLQATVLRAANREVAMTHLATLVRAEGWKRIATHPHPFIQTLLPELKLETFQVQANYDKLQLEQCDVAVTGCDALIAQTGSILISHGSAGGRALSVLPPHHLVIAERSQLVPDLSTALERLRVRYAPIWPSSISFITGPSRTGDIERILVLGAHGPKKLTILILDDLDYPTDS